CARHPFLLEWLLPSFDYW
nr:immunoglobulin heavy chain junction region [Macaca mulatta]